MSEASAEETAWGGFRADSPPGGQGHHQAGRLDTEKEDKMVGKRKGKKRLFSDSEEEEPEGADKGQMEESHTPERDEDWD